VIVRFAPLAGAKPGDRGQGTGQASSAEGGYTAGLRNAGVTVVSPEPARVLSVVVGSSRAGRPRSRCCPPRGGAHREATGRLFLVPSGYPAAGGYGRN
jgi:hypothetical protein